MTSLWQFKGVWLVAMTSLSCENLGRLSVGLQPQKLPKVKQKHVANVWFKAKLEYNHQPLSIDEHTISILYIAGTCNFHTY